MNKEETINTIKRAIKISKDVNDRSRETLTPREWKILELRFGLGDEDPYTLDMIGRMFGITKERVRQIQMRATKRSFALDK